jgi:hypothetical protein
MVRGREAEPDSHIRGTTPDGLGAQRDGDTHRLQHIGSTRVTRRGAIAVFDHRSTSGCGDERRHGGDVHGPRAISPGAHDVEHDVESFRSGNQVGEFEHHLGEFPNLCGLLALHPQADDESGCLGGRGIPGEDLAHRPSGGVRREVPSGGQGREYRRPGALGHGIMR